LSRRRTLFARPGVVNREDWLNSDAWISCISAAWCYRDWVSPLAVCSAALPIDIRPILGSGVALHIPPRGSFSRAELAAALR